MSYPKMCAAFVAITAAVLLFAAPASATVLCKAEPTTTCPSRYGAGTVVDGHLREKEQSLTEERPLTEVTYTNRCNESTLKFKTTNEGGVSQTVTAATETFNFGSCGLYSPPVVLKKPSLELHWTSGTKSAQITAKGIEITVIYVKQDCVYGVPGGGSTAIGQLTGGKQEIDLNMELTRLSGFFCPEKMAWLAKYEVTSPNPLYAAAS